MSIRRLAAEMGILYGLLILVNVLFAPANLGLTGYQPTPYLLPIALVAARYGWAAGMACAGCGAVLYEALGLLGGHPPNPLAPANATALAAMLLGAALLGALFDGLHRENRKWRNSAEDAVSRLAVLTSHNEVLETVNRELRGQIMGETQTIESLYEMAQRLTTLEGQALFPAALDLICEQTGAEACRFLLAGEGQLRIMAQRGGDGAHAVVPADQGLIGRAVRDRRLVTVREEGLGSRASAAAAGEPIVAAPLLAPEGNLVLGVITIDRLPFTRFTPHAVKVISVIADWTARAMGNVALFSEQESMRAREEKAIADLVERLRRHTLTRRDLDYLEALAGSIAGHLMAALHSSREDMTIRSNALLVLERISAQLTPTDVAALKTFAREELDWLLRTWFDFICIDRVGEREALGLLRFYMRGQIAGLARQVLTAQAIVIHRELGVEPQAVRRAFQPLLERAAAPRSGGLQLEGLEALRGWAGESFSQRFAFVARDDVSSFLDYNQTVLGYRVRPLEDILIDLLTRRDRWLVCTALHSMAELGWSAFRWEAFKLVHDPDRFVREAALAALVRLFGVAPLPQVVEAVQGAVNDDDPGVRGVAREILETWQIGSRPARTGEGVGITG